MLTARFEPAGTVAGVPLAICRHPRARRLKLRFDGAQRLAILTAPPRYPAARALRWAEGQAGWIAARLAEQPMPRPILPGAALPFRGEDIAIDWREGLPRAPRLDGGALRIGGPQEALASRVLSWLKAEARTRLSWETEFYAERANVAVDRVSIGDARTRWGSCSARGTIRYSWRLVMAPPRVLAATAAHEVAHRVHMHHGPEFHALVEQLFEADPAPERAWLRANGPMLHSVGVSS